MINEKIIVHTQFFDEATDDSYTLEMTIAEMLDSCTEEGCPELIGWIPCSEKMPEERRDVLLQMPHNMIVGFWENVLGDVTWNAYFTDIEFREGYNNPIAWMPLPEPYKAGDTE